MGPTSVYSSTSNIVYSVNHPNAWSHCVSVLAGNLENVKKNTFVLKEGVDYKIKITFKVRLAAEGVALLSEEREFTPDAFLRSTRRSSQASDTPKHPPGKE